MKVLLVEDYHDTRRLMRMFLEQQGCVVVAAIAEVVAQTPEVDETDKAAACRRAGRSERIRQGGQAARAANHCTV